MSKLDADYFAALSISSLNSSHSLLDETMGTMGTFEDFNHTPGHSPGHSPELEPYSAQLSHLSHLSHQHNPNSNTNFNPNPNFNPHRNFNTQRSLLDGQRVYGEVG
eukprot:CAMPEP_0173253946 /NCGR_PEP_ID=MMETSP1142-20121109/21631_1 /TAXON_ID=483371 /ORGANISM="non described non described, Strain CCMP2298" /LENGTH=105 /DNA_ID=CAMNT_0014187289 /DNA_START=32 /DNA_END=345 /DNA_ORIENTATION=-